MKPQSVLEELVGPMTVGMLLKAHRVANSLTAAQLEKKLRLSRGKLASIESGKTKFSLKETIKVARKLGEYEDFYALIWFQEEARNAGLDFHKYLRSHVD